MDNSKQLQKLQDSLDSAHHRLDRFYSWASQLQVETRNIQQRLKFTESQLNIDFGGGNGSRKNSSGAEESSLLARLEEIKGHVR
jgi:hypothetical protein